MTYKVSSGTLNLCSINQTFNVQAKFQVSSFSRSKDRKGSQNSKLAPPLSVWDHYPCLTQCSMGPQ